MDENMVVADVTDPSSLAKAMDGIDGVVLCTSAVPKASEDFANRRHFVFKFASSTNTTLLY